MKYAHRNTSAELCGKLCGQEYTSFKLHWLFSVSRRNGFENRCPRLMSAVAVPKLGSFQRWSVCCSQLADSQSFVPEELEWMQNRGRGTGDSYR
jgi:hypothetical protein